MSSLAAARRADAPELVPADGRRRAFVVVAALGIAVHVAFASTDSMSSVVDDWLYCGLYLLAAASCAWRALRGDARTAWAVAAVGLVIWGSAEIVFRISAPDPHSWYPRS